MAEVRTDSSTIDASSRSKKSVIRFSLTLGWLLILTYVGCLVHNAWPWLQGSTPPPASDLIARLIALPGLTNDPSSPVLFGVALTPDLAYTAACLIAALMAFLTLILISLTFFPLPERSKTTAALRVPANPHNLPASSQRAPELPEVARSASVSPAQSTLTPPPRIFISHASGDNAFGAQIAQFLRDELGSVDTVWYDSLGRPSDSSGGIGWAGGIHPAGYWEREIFRELRDRPVFVLLLSQAALDSPWVQDEILLAWKQKNERGRAQPKVIVPVLLPDARDLPIPEPLDLIQFVSFVERPGWTVEQAYQALLAAIRAERTQLLPDEPEPPFDLSELHVPDPFVGREEDLEWVLKRLGSKTTTAITAVRGLGGIGKTSLAAVVVQRVFEESLFPSGVIVQVCRELRDPVDLLKRILASFDPERRQPETDDLKRLAEVAQRLFRNRRILIVLDNVEPDDADSESTWKLERVVTPLRQAGATLLITARQVLPISVVSLADSRQLALLSHDEAVELFAVSMGRQSVNDLTPSERMSAERIVHVLDCHTLAVKLAGAYAGGVGRDLDELAREVEVPGRAIALPDGETPRAVGIAFAHSVDALNQDGQRVFAALAVFAANDFGRQAALALAQGLGADDPEATVTLLVLRALLDPRVDTAMPSGSDRERLRLHPLLHGFARMRWGQWAEADRERAYQAVADHYAVYLVGHGASYEARYTDETNVEGFIEWAYQNGKNKSLVELCQAMGEYWDNMDFVQQGTYYLPRAAAAAEEIASYTHDHRDIGREANLLLVYVGILTNAGSVKEALAPCERCLALFREARDEVGESHALEYLGDIAYWRGQISQAEEYYQQCLAIAQHIGDRARERQGLLNLGNAAMVRGQASIAKPLLQRALMMAHDTEDRYAVSICLTSIGWCAYLLDDLDTAEATLLEALDIDRQLRYRTGEGVDLQLLSEVTWRRGQLAESESLCRQALGIAEEVLDQSSEAQCLELLGRVLLQRGAITEAVEHLRKAYELAHEMDLPSEEARTLCTLAESAELSNDIPSAETYYRQSLQVAAEGENGIVQADVLLGLGRLLYKQGKCDEGCRMIRQSKRMYRGLGLPGESLAHEVAIEAGCMNAEDVM